MTNRLANSIRFSMPYGSLMVLAATTLIAGCNDSGLRQVEGVVTIAGEPLTTGRIEFVPEVGRRATGNIQSNGSFKLMTFKPGDGAKIGDYKVLIEAVETEGQQKMGTSIFDEPSVDPSSFKRRTLVHPRYGSLASSPLVATVKSSGNQINFELEQ
ncbi:hypothetical protein MalM25_18740 [Planctomycetes bacterium MalM25]|nr:hypothetical protein MalM25_18740 [Planctomycetes bacterium MalM25]